MNYCRCGGLLFILILFFSTWSCVPVEEEQEAVFDVSFQNPRIREIYDLQVRQQGDSLITFLSHEDPSIRYAAVRAFASFQDTSRLESILPLLQDNNVEIRAMAAYAVGQIGSSLAEDRLTAAFDGRDSARLYMEANGAILEAMGKIGSPQSLKALSTISTYTRTDTALVVGQVRGIYRYALRDMTDEEGTRTMVRYLTDTSMPFGARLVAAHYLHRTSNLSLAAHQSDLVAIWHAESDPLLRMCIATAIGKLKTDDAKKLLMESLQTETDYRVRCNMLRALQTYPYADIHELFLQFAKSSNPAVAEVAAQYFIHQGKENDAALYHRTVSECKTWQAKTRMAEAANKYMTSLFSAPKVALQKDIESSLQASSNVYEKAAWLKALASELRNFESLPKYATMDQPAPVRTQAVQSLIDACRDKNFDLYFAGEGHLIRSQIGGYLANAMRTGDAGILALIAGAITDPETGLKSVLNDRKADLSKAQNNLKLPAEMETYLEISKALAEYGIQSPPINEQAKAVKKIDWGEVDKARNTQIIMVTSKGSIVFALYPDEAPATVSSFLQLVRDGFYNGKAFHRVVPNFVIQTGCPRGDGFGSLDFTIRSELTFNYYDDEGYLGMASAGLHTEGTQFFITHSPAPHLDGRYTIFGKVISGMDVVHQIGMEDTITQINIQ